MKLKQTLIWSVVVAILVAATGSASAQSEPSPRLTPAAVKRGWFENRRIMIEVMTDSAFTPTTDGLRPGAPATFPFGEHFGIRIGNAVPVRINVYVLKPQNADERKIEVDFSALKRGSLTIDAVQDPDFKLVSPQVLPNGEAPATVPEAGKDVVLKIGDMQYPAELYEIRLYVQTMRAPQPMRFAVEFAYAASVVETSGAPDWKRVFTPEYILSMSRTADDGSDLSSGNTAVVAQNPPTRAAFFMLSLGAIAILVPAAFVLLGIVRRNLLKERLLDPEEKAWLVIAPILDQTQCQEGYNLNEAQVRTIVGAILEYIGRPSLRSDQLDALKFEDDDGDLIISILRPMMDGVMLGGLKGENLSAKRAGELMARVEQLIPRS